MRGLLASREQNLLQLLELLQKKNFATFLQLQEAMQVNTRTLTALIEYSNELFYPIRIQKIAEGPVKLILPSNLSVSYCYQKILTASPEFQLIELVFLETLTLDDLADKLFISRSTLRRLLRKINEILAMRDFQIDPSTLDFTGDEKQICNFMIHLFMEKYSDCTFLFSEHRVQFVEKIIKQTMKKRSVPLSFPDFFRVKVWLLIIFHRADRKVLKPSVSQETYFQRPSFLSAFSTSSLRSNLGFALKRNRYLDFIDAVISDGFIFSYQELLDKADQNPSLKERKQKFEEIIHNIEAYFNISTENSLDKILVDLCNVSNLQIGPPYILYDSQSIFIREASKFNSSFIQSLQDLFGTVYPHLKTHVLHTYIYILITHWPKLLSELRKNAEKLAISLVFDSDSEHLDMIKELIQTIFPHKFSVTVINTFENLTQLPTIVSDEIIVTNIQGLVVSDKTIISFSLYPTTEELENLFACYEENCHKKRL